MSYDTYTLESVLWTVEFPDSFLFDEKTAEIGMHEFPPASFDLLKAPSGLKFTPRWSRLMGLVPCSFGFGLEVYYGSGFLWVASITDTARCDLDL